MRYLILTLTTTPIHHSISVAPTQAVLRVLALLSLHDCIDKRQVSFYLSADDHQIPPRTAVG